MANFGQTGVDPDDDPDADGLTNADEWKAGTDPNDYQSQFKFIHIDPSPAVGLRVEWSSSAGKTYTVLRSATVLGGFEAIASGISATPPANIYPDPTATGEGPYFYLLRVEE